MCCPMGTTAFHHHQRRIRILLGSPGRTNVVSYQESLTTFRKKLPLQPLLHVWNCCANELQIAVITAVILIAERAPHRSRHALFTHRAPT